MKKNSKIEYISKVIDAEERVTVADLAQRMNITEKTVRIYLSQLEKAGVLIRTHGGAIRNHSSQIFPLDNEYRLRALNLKREITRTVLYFIKENDVIVLDDGSTCLELAKQLGAFPVTVITNDLQIANELVGKEKVKLIIVGGEIGNSYYNTVADDKYAESFIKRFKADIYFSACATIDEHEGIMIFHHGNKNYKRACMSISKQIVCLVDSGKFDKTSFVKVADYNEMDIVVTDSQISQEVYQRYSQLKPKFIIANKYGKIENF